jgi:hypothetical protein
VNVEIPPQVRERTVAKARTLVEALPFMTAGGSALLDLDRDVAARSAPGGLSSGSVRSQAEALARVLDARPS